MAFPTFLSLLLLFQAAPGDALEKFFIGPTEGSGTVSIILSGSHSLRDHTRGRIDAQGALILDQVVEEQGKPTRRRNWRLVRSGANRVTGTISDARGPVSGEFSGDTLHLSYRMVEGPSAEQWITLQPDGRSATAHMIVRRFGLRVGSMDAVIHKGD